MRAVVARAILGVLVLCGVAVLGLPPAACAGEKDKAGKETKPGKSAPVLPDPDKIVLLVRTTLSTVNDAVQTGNYTVLRDKAAPSFRDGTTGASLAQSLATLQQQRIDLSAVSIIAPQLTELPFIGNDDRLKLKGYFPGQPIGIAFDLTFEVVQGSWRLFALSIGLAQTPAVADKVPAGKADATAAKKKAQ